MAIKKKAKKIQNRRTPLWLFAILVEVFGKFRLDAAASRKDTLCKWFFTKNDNGLLQPWRNRTFCNPPFAETKHWVQKAYFEMTERKIESVLILPVGCSQQWYHSFATAGVVYIPSRRINFDLPDGTPTDRADRDTIILHFDPKSLQTRMDAIAEKGLHWDVRRLDIPPKMKIK